LVGQCGRCKRNGEAILICGAWLRKLQQAHTNQKSDQGKGEGKKVGEAWGKGKDKTEGATAWGLVIMKELWKLYTDPIEVKGPLEGKFRPAKRKERKGEKRRKGRKWVREKICL